MPETQTRQRTRQRFRKVKPRADLPPEKLILRFVEVRPETANDDDLSIDVVVASENPVERYDENSQEVVREILSMDGVRFRTNRRQLPIVDSHDRSTIRNVLGSIRNINPDGSQLVGKASFARDKDSQDAYWKVKDGHVTDFSITAQPNAVTRIKRGERSIFRDTEIEGPADIVTDWTTEDASLVAVGADETSTVRTLRRSYENPQLRKRSMNEDIRQNLIAMGMPEDIETSDGALVWFIANSTPPTETEEPIEMAEDTVTTEPEATEETPAIENADESPVVEEVIENAADDTEEVQRSARAAVIKRNKEIQSLCTAARIERAFADELCEQPDVTLSIARERILEKMISRDKPLGNGSVEVTASSDEKFTAAMRDGLIQRASRQTGRKPLQNPADGSQDFERMNLRRMADTFCTRHGINTSRINEKDIAMIAMGHSPTINRMRHSGIMRSEPAWHTTGTFTNLLLDAMNKTLLDGYEEAPITWNMWARQGNSTSDLKEIHRIKYSEFPDLQDVPEGHDYPEGKTSDAKESYRPVKKGRVLSITWETIVNDDMDAISRVPQMQGAAARRTQNKAVYSVLTDNSSMADNVALFHADHSNLAGSGAVISETTLNAAYTAMMTQTNLGGELIGVEPKYLIVPAAISATALQTMVSITPPTVGGDTTGTSGTVNLYGPNGSRRLEVIVVPQLDANSATAWYLASDYNQVDTVELTFLEGEETPVLESWWEEINDKYCYKVRQTFGVAPIDYRGLYKNPGA